MSTQDDGTWSKEGIKCPRCGYVDEDYFDYGSDLESGVDTECIDCGAPIRVVAHVDYTLNTAVRHAAQEEG